MFCIFCVAVVNVFFSLCLDFDDNEQKKQNVIQLKVFNVFITF